jgi:hypothetical protein
VDRHEQSVWCDICDNADNIKPDVDPESPLWVLKGRAVFALWTFSEALKTFLYLSMYRRRINEIFMFHTPISDVSKL